MSLLGFLLIGLAAGFIAGRIMHGSGFGFWGNLGVGIVGAMLGGILFDLLGIGANGGFWSLVTATIGALAFLSLAALIKK